MELLHTLDLHKAEITCLAFTPNGNYLATGSYDETIIIWNVQDKFKNIARLTIKNDWITCLSFSSDSSTLAAGSSLGYVKFWDMLSPTFVPQ